MILLFVFYLSVFSVCLFFYLLNSERAIDKEKKPKGTAKGGDTTEGARAQGRRPTEKKSDEGAAVCLFDKG